MPDHAMQETAAAISQSAVTPSHVNPCLASLEKFDGDPAKCKGFLLQCSLFVHQQPTLYPTSTGKISLGCSLLTGKTLDWITPVWKEDGSAFPTFEIFLEHFKAVFDHSKEGKSAGERLLVLPQDKKTAAEYALTFRMLTTQTNWVEDTLKVLFRKGLNPNLQLELACRD